MSDLLNLHTGINAYNDVQKSSNNFIKNIGDNHQAGHTGFSDMLSTMLQSAKQVFNKSETMTNKAVYNKASITDVATAISEAEVALQTMVSLRDKLINVYNDVMKMQM